MGAVTSSSSLSVAQVESQVNSRLEAAWNWLVAILDCTEAQLRFGSSLSSIQQFSLATSASADSASGGLSASQYIRHLEERALVTNYYNNTNFGIYEHFY